MPANYVLLATQTVGASAASVTFSNIPQTGYTDLKIVYSARSTVASNLTGFGLAFNGTRTSTLKRLFANDGTAYGDSNVGNGQGEAGFATGASSTASTFGNTEIYIPNYTGSQQKVYSVDSVTEKNSTTGYITGMFAGQNTITAAITSITISDNSGGNIDAGSTFYLYGLAQVGTTPAIAPYASGGDVIANDGTYWYHAFKTTGAFVPAKALTADILVVAGGGGSGYAHGGGAGAGGVLAFASQALTTTSYTCTIGAGGVGRTSDGGNGTNGVNSQFASLTAAVGGGGGGTYGRVGSNGGSGGGAGAAAGAGTTGGTATSGQGNVGGNSNTSGGAGGGGAGGAGSNTTTGQGSNGGAAISTVTNWGSLSSALTATALGVSGAIAGGGGGGNSNGQATAGLSGGGGATDGGKDATNPSNAVANTGSGAGGGGGDSSAYFGANGGSGVVIIRYAMA